MKKLEERTEIAPLGSGPSLEKEREDIKMNTRWAVKLYDRGE
jgi:hypothetical protein